MVLLWVMNNKPKRNIISKTNYSFSELHSVIADYEKNKKHPRKLKNLKRVANIVQTYTAKYPEIAEGFEARVDKRLQCGSEYFCDQDVQTLAGSVGDWRKALGYLPGLRTQYPFETHIIEHAEELVPDLLPYLPV